MSRNYSEPLTGIARDRRLVVGPAGIAELHLAGDARMGVSQTSSVPSIAELYSAWLGSPSCTWLETPAWASPS